MGAQFGLFAKNLADIGLTGPVSNNSKTSRFSSGSPQNFTDGEVWAKTLWNYNQAGNELSWVEYPYDDDTKAMSALPNVDAK